MQKMLRRTVTVGKRYALHIWTGFLFILSGLLSLFIIAGFNGWQSFTAIACIIVAWSLAGIIVSFYALSMIQDAAAQVRRDLSAVLRMMGK